MAWLAQLLSLVVDRVQTEMRWLPLSATKSVKPSEVTATPTGPMKLSGPLPLEPNVVGFDHSVNGGEDVLSIGYDELIAPMIKAIQEQQSQIATQQALVENQQAQIEQLRSRITALGG